jgi:hypothetical protein
MSDGVFDIEGEMMNETIAVNITAPTSIFGDSYGNIYIGSNETNVIYVIDAATLLISIFAGTGESTDYNGDRQLAVNATISEVYGLYVDTMNNLYFADTGYCRIRRVEAVYVAPTMYPTIQVTHASPTRMPTAHVTMHSTEPWIAFAGTISTVAGNGQCNYTGDNGAANSSSLNYPRGIYKDVLMDELYIADTENEVIRKVSADGIISTYAALPNVSWIPATFHGITGDSTGNIYVSDSMQHVVYRVYHDGNHQLVVYAGTIGFAGDTGDNGRSEYVH